MANSELSNSQRAEVLTQALPYIRKYIGKKVVVKYGGNAMTDETLKQQVMEDVALLHLIGVKVILVHGGGPDISDMMRRMGKEAVFVDGLRATDTETMDIVQMVLSGRINKRLVSLIERYGGSAIGISGMDGKLIEAKQKDPKLGYVGEVTRVNVGLVEEILAADYVPVISTVGWDSEGYAYNINGDTAAGAIAGALGAERLIMMTDIEGVMADRNDPTSLIPELTVRQCEELKASGVISGGMIPKVDCCTYAIAQGVKNVVIIDGRVPHAILMELLTDEGAGTWIKGE